MIFLRKNRIDLARNKIKGEKEGRKEGIFNIKDSGDQIDDEGETYEEVYKRDIEGGRDSRKERRECQSVQIKGTCVIWCGKMPF